MQHRERLRFIEEELKGLWPEWEPTKALVPPQSPSEEEVERAGTETAPRTRKKI